MASSSEPHHYDHHHVNHISRIIQSTASNLSSLLTPKTTPSATPPVNSPSKICAPLLFADSSAAAIESIQSLSFSSKPSSFSSSSSAMKGMPSESGSAFPSTVRISGLNSPGKSSGPAFVGQVFSMCDLSGTGLMAVSTHFDIPFISKRTPDWLKKMFSAVIKSERNGPVFRFFMDLGDAGNIS
ncbi:unnamed protein product [Ilex paraguariensis]|uniref:Uncharacterized protein n=1 Tax=Ilex paraguariensis TaxID=185542 RepID=A0ABC8U611_9AQUA